MAYCKRAPLEEDSRSHDKMRLRPVMVWLCSPWCVKMTLVLLSITSCADSVAGFRRIPGLQT